MGFLLCEKCGDYYKLQKGESPKDFEETQEEYTEINNVTDEIIELYDLAHKKRLDSQYMVGYDVRVSKSKTSRDRAKKFVLELEKVLIEL